MGFISRSVTIIERANFDLKNLTQIWGDKQKRSEYQDYFSAEKFTFYIFQAMKLIDYLHSVNIYYGDVKPANLLIFRN